LRSADDLHPIVGIVPVLTGSAPTIADATNEESGSEPMLVPLSFAVMFSPSLDYCCAPVSS
jgi:hypothetical protein